MSSAKHVLDVSMRDLSHSAHDRKSSGRSSGRYTDSSTCSSDDSSHSNQNEKRAYQSAQLRRQREENMKEDQAINQQGKRSSGNHAGPPPSLHHQRSDEALLGDDQASSKAAATRLSGMQPASYYGTENQRKRGSGLRGIEHDFLSSQLHNSRSSLELVAALHPELLESAHSLHVKHSDENDDVDAEVQGYMKDENRKLEGRLKESDPSHHSDRGYDSKSKGYDEGGDDVRLAMNPPTHVSPMERERRPSEDSIESRNYSRSRSGGGGSGPGDDTIDIGDELPLRKRDQVKRVCFWPIPCIGLPLIPVLLFLAFLCIAGLIFWHFLEDTEVLDLKLWEWAILLGLTLLTLMASLLASNIVMFFVEVFALRSTIFYYATGLKTPAMISLWGILMLVLGNVFLDDWGEEDSFMWYVKQFFVVLLVVGLCYAFRVVCEKTMLRRVANRQYFKKIREALYREQVVQHILRARRKYLDKKERDRRRQEEMERRQNSNESLTDRFSHLPHWRHSGKRRSSSAMKDKDSKKQENSKKQKEDGAQEMLPSRRGGDNPRFTVLEPRASWPEVSEMDARLQGHDGMNYSKRNRRGGSASGRTPFWRTSTTGSSKHQSSASTLHARRNFKLPTHMLKSLTALASSPVPEFDAQEVLSKKERQARAEKLAADIFEFLHLRGTHRDESMTAESCLRPSDFAAVFHNRFERRRAFLMFAEAATDRRVTQHVVSLVVLDIYEQRKSLAKGLSDRNDVAAVLSGLVGIFFWLVMFVVVLLLFGADVNTVILPMASLALSASFAFGPTLREVLEAGILVLFVHPYDVGDRIYLNSVDTPPLIVKKLRLFRTTCSYTDGRWIAVPNRDIVAAPIINYHRSNMRVLSPTLLLGFDTPWEKVLELRERIFGFLRQNPDIYDEGAMVNLVRIGRQNEIEVTTWIPLRYILWCKVGEWLSVQTALLAFLKQTTEELGMDYHLPPQPFFSNSSQAPSFPGQSPNNNPPNSVAAGGK